MKSWWLLMAHGWILVLDEVHRSNVDYSIENNQVIINTDDLLIAWQDDLRGNGLWIETRSATKPDEL